MTATEPSKNHSKTAEMAARGVLVKVGTWKRLFIRLVESFAWPLVLILERVSASQHSQSFGDAKRILVLEYWNLGDMVMLTPFLRGLRTFYPKAHIVLVTSPRVAPLLEHQELVDEVIIARVPWTEHYSRWRKYNPVSSLWTELLHTIKDLRHQDFDLAFSGRADVRDNLILCLTGAKRRVGYAFGGGGHFLTDVVTPDLQHPHYSSRWLHLLQITGKSPLLRDPCLKLTDEEQISARQCLLDCGIEDGDFLIAIHSQARSAVREWGDANFKALVERLRSELAVKVVWFRDPGQAAKREEIDGIVSFSLPLREFMSVLANCHLLICNDSGPMHIATGLGVPVVAIFGPTEPAWFRPLGDGHHVVIQEGFWCRPCFDYCQFSEPYCMRTINVDTVFEAAVGAFSRINRGRGVRSSPQLIGRSAD